MISACPSSMKSSSTTMKQTAPTSRAIRIGFMMFLGICQGFLKRPALGAFEDALTIGVVVGAAGGQSLLPEPCILSVALALARILARPPAALAAAEVAAAGFAAVEVFFASRQAPLAVGADMLADLVKLPIDVAQLGVHSQRVFRSRVCGAGASQRVGTTA